MTTKTACFPAASWTHHLDSERHKEHDFANLLLEFRYAIERKEPMLMRYCESELDRMYRERRPARGQR
jgi:hypothetical protein